MDIALSPRCHKHKPIIWHKPSRIQTPIEANYLPWLLDKGSLTQKLIAKAEGEFHVKVLRQSIRRVPFSDQQVLKLPTRQWAVVREVILYGQRMPWVYAYTVIPLSTLHGRLRRLHYLGNRSLGEQLFTDPSMQREPVQIAQLHPQQLPQQLQLSSPTWGRRSVFRLSNKPLLVSEIFLPDLVTG